jgi:SOS-response transcriptional repressor LexA
LSKNYAKNIEILRNFFNTNNSGLEKLLGLSNGYISNIEKSDNGERRGTDNPGRLLIALSKKGISTDWFLTGKGEIQLSNTIPVPIKHPFMEDLEKLIGTIVDAKLLSLGLLDESPEIFERPSEKTESSEYIPESEAEYGGGYVKILYVNNIAAGPPIHQSENPSEYIDVPQEFIRKQPDNYYVAHVRGESMTAAGIPDDSNVLICKSDVPKDGTIQVVRRGGKSTLKRVRDVAGKGWRLCYEDGSGRCIELEAGAEYQVQGDFVTVLSLGNAKVY